VLLNSARALALMTQARLDALVITSPVNIKYFTDYWLWSDDLFREYMLSPGASSSRLQFYAVFPIDGEPALVLPPLSAANASDSWVKDIYVYGESPFERPLRPPISNADQVLARLSEWRQADTPVDAVAAALQQRRLAASRLGVELEGLSPAAHDALRRKLPEAEIADATNLIRLIRSVKSATEIQLLKRCAEINELAALEALRTAGPGVSVKEITETFRIVVARNGANFDHAAFGMHGLGLATEPDWSLTDEFLFADFGCTYAGYFSDTGFTLAIAQVEPSQEYQALVAGIRAGVGVLRPGTPSSLVQGEMKKALADHNVRVCFPHGHGLGLEIRDYPILVPPNGLRIRDGCVDVSSDLSLEAGMVINLEASVWYPGTGSAQVEQTFEITADGSKPVARQDRSSPFRPT
jgi:Xaa-Pro dipeptidase